MSEKNLLNKVRELLGMEVKLEQRKLEDGVTIIEADEFAPENEVVIITEDEQRIPLPIGEYKMDDGMILVVTEEGLIAEIKEEAAEEEEEVIEEEAKKDYDEKEEEMADEAKPVKKVVESIVKETFFNEIETLKKENEELKAKLQNLSKVETTEETEEVTSEKVVEDEKTELSTEELDPAVKPISFNPENKEVREKMLYAQNRTETTLDRVFKKLNK